MLSVFEHEGVCNNSQLNRERDNLSVLVAGTLVEYLNRAGFLVAHIHQRKGQSIFTHFEVPLSDLKE